MRCTPPTGNTGVQPYILKNKEERERPDNGALLAQTAAPFPGFGGGAASTALCSFLRLDLILFS